MELEWNGDYNISFIRPCVGVIFNLAAYMLIYLYLVGTGTAGRDSINRVNIFVNRP